MSKDAPSDASAIQSDGKIIVAGSIGDNPDYGFALVRYNRDGSLDNGFGTGGRVTTDFSGQQAWAAALIIQPDGKIVAAGASGGGFALARYNQDGSLDATFGIGGKITTDFSGASARALGLQSDGKIVAAGSLPRGRSPYNTDFALARYNTDGSLDTTFGADGRVTTDFEGHADHVMALAIQSDGRIVAAGMMSVPPSGEIYSGLLSGRGALVRYNRDGSIDTTFGSSGRVVTDNLGTSEIRALVIQSDGKIVGAGFCRSGVERPFFALVRYNEDGSLESTFGTLGKVTTSLGSLGDRINAVALQPDGKIVAAGESALSDWGSYAFGLARYNRDGSLDVSFGIGGKVRTDPRENQFVYALYARTIGIQPDGKIVVVGSTELFYCTSVTCVTSELARYETTGLQIVSAMQFDTASTRVGGSWNVLLSGSNLTNQTYFDLRFRSPGSTTEQVALNWQQGTSARHTVIEGTEAGTWIVTGIRAHESVDDHGGEFVPVSKVFIVTAD